MDTKLASYLLETTEEPDELRSVVDLLKKHLALDNNKLREDFVCSIFGYQPSYGGAGFPDGYKPDGTPVDNKSGPNIIFPDWEYSIEKKLDWICLVNEWSDSGQLIYVAEVRVNEIINELRESRDIKRNKGGRISPSVPYTVWKDTPSAKILYKNVSLFPRLNTGAFKRRFEVLNYLPYEDTVTIC